MMQQWFSQNAISSPPDAIIIPTQSILDRFVRRIKLLAYENLRNELIERQDFIVESLIQAMQYDNRIQTEIMCGTMDIVRHEFNLDDREDIGVVASAVMELAEELYYQLCELKAYENGYLFYQYHSLDGRDVVMVRLTPPEISAKGNYGRYRR